MALDIEKEVTLSRLVIGLVVAILTGGGLFTGYQIKAETRSFNHDEMKIIMREELRDLTNDVGHMRESVSVIRYRQEEFARRLQRLEGP